ncbi:unnamed protein product, partial [Staurois parvus]
VLQTLFYAVSFLTDLLLPIRGIKLVKFVIYCRDLLFSVLAFPASTFVFLSFWALYTYDRQLVYPEGLDKVIPLWLNHAVHTAVFPIAVLEIVTSPHHYPPKRKGLTLLGICSVAYLSWVLWIYIADGNWVYPFLGLLNPFGFILFLLSSNILAALVYIAGDTLNYLIWGKFKNKRELPSLPVLLTEMEMLFFYNRVMLESLSILFSIHFQELLILLLYRIYIAPTVFSALYNRKGDNTIRIQFNTEGIGGPCSWSLQSKE